jgi:hypothetical protein
MTLVPRSAVEPEVTVMVKSYVFTATLPLLRERSGSPV